MTKRKPGAKRGKPPYVPTKQDRLLVEAYVGVGMTEDEICGALSRPPDHERGPFRMALTTLRKYYSRELTTARVKMVARMRIKLIAKADAGDVAALLHVNRVFGWNERLIIVDGGTDVDPATLSDADIEARMAKLRRSTAVMRATKAPDTLH